MFPRQFDPDAPEMMDRAQPDPQLLQQQLHSLRQMNRYFGGASAYEQAFRRLHSTASPATVLDLCTGSGDHLRCLLARNPSLKVLALDRQWETLQVARRHLPAGPSQCLLGDALALPLKDRSVDFVLCSLALHHFTEQQAAKILGEIRRVARIGGAVIDLTRGSLAYSAVWLLTALWMKDPYTRHDGRASVKAAFSPEELIKLAKRAEWASYWYMELPWFRQAIGFSHLPQLID